jgi:hypothetical protein
MAVAQINIDKSVDNLGRALVCFEVAAYFAKISFPKDFLKACRLRVSNQIHVSLSPKQFGETGPAPGVPNIRLEQTTEWRIIVPKKENCSWQS